MSGDRSGNCSRAGRDHQRARVYRAEDSVSWGRELTRLERAQEFIERITATSFWESLPHAPRIVTLRDGRGRRSACAEPAWFGAVIKLPRWARCELLLLHELAHTVTPKAESAHGAAFAANYLKLVRRFLSEETWQALRRAFDLKGVAYRDESGGRQPLKVLQWVRELQALSRASDSPAEAANAAAKVQHLLLKHNLSILEVERPAGEDVNPLVEERRRLATVKRRVPYWKQMLLSTVARGTLCEWMLSFCQDARPRTFSFIGRRGNVEVACFLFTSLERQIDERWVIERDRLRAAGEALRGRRASFCEGLVDGIEERLSAGRVAFESRGDECRALVRTRDREARSFFRKLYPDVRFTTYYGSDHPSSRELGRRAARDLQIQFALGHAAKPRRLLE